MKSYAYSHIDRAWKTKFLTSQADGSCLAVRPATSFQTQFVVEGLDIQNNSGSTAVAGLAGRLPISLWKAGQCTSANAFTDDTTNAQSNVSDAFALGTNGGANSGIMVLCRVPFNVLSVVTTTPATSGTTFSLAYSTGTSTWTEISAALVAPDWTPTAGEQLVTWGMPGPEWVPCLVGHGAGIPLDAPGWYGIRIRETANNTAAGKARVLVLGSSIYATVGLATGSILSVAAGLGEINVPPQCDGLAGLISVAADNNLIRGRYRMKG